MVLFVFLFLFQARNLMGRMREGDLALFYHSNCKDPGVVGVVEVCSTGWAVCTRKHAELMQVAFSIYFGFPCVFVHCCVRMYVVCYTGCSATCICQAYPM